MVENSQEGPSGAYTALLGRIKDCFRLKATSFLLEWDQETYMPPEGVDGRAELSSLIAGLAHDMLVADETRSLLEKVGQSTDDEAEATNVRETARLLDRESKVPTALVKDIAESSALAKDAWVKARERSDFSLFVSHLSRMVDLKKQLAEHVGYEDDPYDALLDEFEPGSTAAQVEAVLKDVSTLTVKLLEKISQSPVKPDRSILERHYPRAAQEKLSRQMAEALGFAFSAGRADETAHPFCTTIGGGSDVRITTRYLENFLPSSLFGTMHEVGHGLYEQGLLAEHRFTPMAQAVSLGIHESQSRMWENMVGRSRPFWNHHYAGLQSMFTDALSDVPIDNFYRAINCVTPTFIRVEADEITYNLHIILRFELERELFNGQLEVKDLPQAWNDRFKQLLGVTPPDDSNGVLQDIHWSMGIFGYFPTYALGNLYAAQFFEKANRDIPDLAANIEANKHSALLDWLRENIHQHGQRFRADELVKRVTGEPLSVAPFERYLTKKYGAIYEF